MSGLELGSVIKERSGIALLLYRSKSCSSLFRTAGNALARLFCSHGSVSKLNKQASLVQSTVLSRSWVQLSVTLLLSSGTFCTRFVSLAYFCRIVHVFVLVTLYPGASGEFIVSKFRNVLYSALALGGIGPKSGEIKL